MKTISLLLLAIIAVSLFSCSTQKKSATTEASLSKILVFSKTEGFRHASIGAGKKAIEKLGKENDFLVETTEDAGYFTKETLAKYKAVVFLNTTQDILNSEQQTAFEGYIQAGNGYVGIHAASDTEYDWPWYAGLMGAHFKSHPNNPNVQEGTFIIVNTDHPSTSFLKGRTEWVRTDEFYNFKEFDPTIIPLLKIDETTYPGGENGDNHPMSWYHEYDGGRAFYTNFGHTKETFSEPDALKHILGGILYAMGKK